MKKFLLILIIGLAFVGCEKEPPTDDDPKPTVPAELQGTWTLGDFVNVFTGNSFSFSNSGGSFTADIHSFTTANNENESTKNEFPSGYNLIGKVISITGTGVGQTVNADFSFSFYLNATKDKMVISSTTAVYEKE